MTEDPRPASPACAASISRRSARASSRRRARSPSGRARNRRPRPGRRARCCATRPRPATGTARCRRFPAPPTGASSTSAPRAGSAPSSSPPRRWQQEDGEPDRARARRRIEAHELAPDLVPAAVVAGRLLSRQGDIRRATRVLEAAWKAAPASRRWPTPTCMCAPAIRPSDRLKRAETLFRMRPDADEGRLAVAARGDRRARLRARPRGADAGADDAPDAATR